MEVDNNKCVICGLILDVDSTVIVKERGLLKFIESSIARDDGKADRFKDRAEIKLHKTCRNTYNNPKCVEAEQKRKIKEAKRVLEAITFDFKNKCLFCDKDASFEFERKQKKNPSSKRISVGQVKRFDTQNSVLKACATHDDDWSKQVLLRIDNVNILEKNARYHNRCYSKFCHSYRPTGNKRGRKKSQLSQANEITMDQVFESIEGNADPNSGALSVGVPDTASQPEPKKRKKKHVGINCSECKKNVFVFRYACVQCEDYELCGACDAAGAHAHHYLLRIPASRPTSEIAEVVAKVRELMSVEVASAGSSAYLSEYRLGDQFATKLADESPDESGDDFSDENNEAIEEEISVKLEVKEEAGAEDPLQAPAPAAEQSDETEAGPAPKRPRTILKDMLLGVKPEPPSDEEDAQTEVYTLTHTTPLAHMDTTYTQTTNVKLEPGTFYEVFSHQSEFSDQSIDQPSCSLAAGNVPVVSHVAASSHAGGSSQVAGSGHTAVSSQAVRKKSKVAATPKK